MTEKELQTYVLSLAHLYGWEHYHTFSSKRSPAGFPDLVLIRPPELLFVELKSAKGRLTTSQDRWRIKLIECEQEYHLWRPCDWFEDTIEQRLKPIIR